MMFHPLHVTLVNGHQYIRQQTIRGDDDSEKISMTGVPVAREPWKLSIKRRWHFSVLSSQSVELSVWSQVKMKVAVIALCLCLSLLVVETVSSRLPLSHRSRRSPQPQPLPQYGYYNRGSTEFYIDEITDWPGRHTTSALQHSNMTGTQSNLNKERASDLKR